MFAASRDINPLSLGTSFPVLEKFFRVHSDVRGYLAKQDWRDILPFVKRDGCGSSILVAKLLVRTALPYLDETEVLEDDHHFSRFEDGQSGHLS